MEFKRSKKKINQTDVENLENKIGFKLPLDYVNFILENNGGTPTKVFFDFIEDGSTSQSVVHLFLPIGEQYKENVLNTYQFFLNENSLPKGIIPIGRDPYGNLICLSLLESQYNQIFFWDHELEDEKNLFFISHSFESFLNNLKELKIETYLFDDYLSLTNKEEIIKNIPPNFDLETEDEFSLTLIENAAIQANKELILYLHSKGAKLRTALDLAIQNAQFFSEHKETVELLKQLYNIK